MGRGGEGRALIFFGRGVRPVQLHKFVLLFRRKNRHGALFHYMRNNVERTRPAKKVLPPKVYNARTYQFEGEDAPDPPYDQVRGFDHVWLHVGEGDPQGGFFSFSFSSTSC